MKGVAVKRLEWIVPLLLLFAHGCLYNHLGDLAARRGVNFGPWLELPADARVPFLPVFVLPYLFVWFFPLVLLGYLAWHRRFDPLPCRRISVAMLVLMLACYALWIAFPVRVDLRLDGAALAEAGVLGDLVRFNYERASQWNACPSFHVAGPWFLYRAVGLYVPRVPRTFLFIVLAIAASTVLIRIHYLLDIASGLLVSELVLRGVLQRLERAEAFGRPVTEGVEVPTRAGS